MGTVVWQTLKARTESRYRELTYDDYRADKGTPPQRKRFHKAWESSVEELHYRLRSAKTRRLFSSAFTQLLCAYSHSELRVHFDEISKRLQSDDDWEDLRDILMLSLSANSYLKPTEEK